MSQPTSLLRGKKQIKQSIKKQFWLLVIFIIIVTYLDKFIFNAELVIAQSFAAGSVLSLTSQYLLAYFVFKNVGYRARRQIVNNLYLGEMIKWLITIIGFIVIFKYLRPINTPAVITGYMLVKVTYMIQMLKTK